MKWNCRDEISFVDRKLTIWCLQFETPSWKTVEISWRMYNTIKSMTIHSSCCGSLISIRMFSCFHFKKCWMRRRTWRDVSFCFLLFSTNSFWLFTSDSAIMMGKICNHYHVNDVMQYTGLLLSLLWRVSSLLFPFTFFSLLYTLPFHRLSFATTSHVPNPPQAASAYPHIRLLTGDCGQHQQHSGAHGCQRWQWGGWGCFVCVCVLVFAFICIWCVWLCLFVVWCLICIWFVVNLYLICIWFVV